MVAGSQSPEAIAAVLALEEIAQPAATKKAAIGPLAGAIPQPNLETKATCQSDIHVHRWPK